MPALNYRRPASVFSPAATLPNGSVLQYVLLGMLLAIPATIYFSTVYQNAYNFPYEDDFNSALSFLSDYTAANITVGDKLKLLFSQYNEHRIVFDRIVFLADYWLFGHLNFRHLILVGNVSLLLICLLFWKVTFRTLPPNQKLLFLLPVSYFLFSFQYWELATWSMAALQNLYVMPFALFSLYSLTRPGRTAFVLACGAALLATYTSGNGMFSFVAGIPILLLLKSYRKLTGWLLTAAVAIGFYFWHYIRPPYHPDVFDSLFNHTGRAISYFFSLTGAIAGYNRPRFAILFGVVSLLMTLGLAGYLWYRKRLLDYLPLLGWMAFLYLTCLSLMASRSGMGVGQAFGTRYGIVVVMLLSTQVILALEVVTRLYLRLGVLAAYSGIAVLFYLSANNKTNRLRLIDRTRQLEYSTAFYNANPANVFLHWGSSGLTAKPFFEDAVRKGIFRVPDLTFRALKSIAQPVVSQKLIASPGITYDATPYSTADFLVFYRASVLVGGPLSREAVVQFVAQSPANSYIFDTYRHTWDDPNDLILNRSYPQPGFSCVIDKKDLKQGQYRLWLRVQEGSKTSYQPLDVALDV